MNRADLKSYMDSRRRCEFLSERIASVRNDIEGIRSVVISDMPKGSSADNERLERLLDLKQALILRYIAEQSGCHRLMQSIECAVGKVDDTRFKILLTLRYIDGRSWDYISDYMGYDKRYIFKLHGRALQAFERAK